MLTVHVFINYTNISALHSVQEMESIGELISVVKARKAVISDSISFHHADLTGCSIFAKTEIAKGTALVSVPFASCITAELIAQSSQLRSLLEENPGYLEYPDEVLAIGLMYADCHHSDVHCEWVSHVRTMPKSFNTTIFWGEDEMFELMGTNVFHLTKMMKKQMVHDFETLHKPLRDAYPELLGGITLESYMWALSIVYSRSVELTRCGEHVRCIVPVLDMANHNPEAADSAFDTFHYDDDSDRVSLLSAADLKAGDECFAVYGLYPNSKLLYNYGFVVLGNPHRAIDLWTRLAPTSYRFDAKQQTLQSHELTRVQTYDFKGTVRPNYVSPALLATIRVVQACDDAEVAQLESAFHGRMVSVRNELATYASLCALLAARLQPEQAEVVCSNLSSPCV